jgi:hypothetical protein
MRKTIYIAVLMNLAFAANAEVFRCETGGRTIYTDQPSDRCEPIAIRQEDPDPQALARLQQNRESYQQSMAQWREHYLRDLEQRTAMAYAQAQRPVVIVTPPEPVYPAYVDYPFFPAYPFWHTVKKAPTVKPAPVQRGPARIGMVK